ncbi:Cell wall-associated hydrolase, NlpC family [Actinopolymorpha cephalotaxi]|uniref:Cell wall-associated NlpC family hydrolase n=1 Tax=Actinopolymorpha cephalotaxi TaxID=504797 RepID=A0A1I2WF85_9ACTN|nr:C40 family peptidase [Actinopolymorpha cephalotaxi]NYH82606.1 cell wall-associated NlpC family hydrolase [Actinopolymorpha cephalotaxi]SFG99975.1 Cell wall-associated hydrolase, NlpC family [Actinopolymorpha cephalotaxi]
MSNRRTCPPGRALLAVGTATVALVAAVPGASYAEPRRDIGQVRKQVDDLYEQAEKAAEQANELNDQTKVIDRRLGKLDVDVARQQKRLNSMRGQIGQFAAAEYRAGAVDSTVQLLVAQDPKEYIAQMSTAEAFAGQQGDLLLQLQSEQKRLSEQKAARQAELARLRDARDAAKARKKQADANVAKAKTVLNQLTAAERRRVQAREQAADRPSRGQERIPLPSGSGRGATALAFARAQLGEPYVFGAAGPSSWDCSGLTMMAWQAAGVSLPHSSRSQYAMSAKVSRSQLRPGDLVLFYSDRHHIGLYAGNGMVLHAPRPGKSVEYLPMRYMPYAGAVRPG